MDNSEVSVTISTHTLRKEGDFLRVSWDDDVVPISTHTLRKEGDSYGCLIKRIPSKISTHTLRKEGDRDSNNPRRTLKDFNPHPPQGG